MKAWIAFLALVAAQTTAASADPDWRSGADTKQREILSSVHASNDCADCHSGEAPAGLKALPPAVDCSACHSDVQDVYLKSVHGKARSEGDTSAAQCSDCHGSHRILSKKDPQSKTHPFHIPQTCGECHGTNGSKNHAKAPKTAGKYLDSIHGRALEKSGLLISAQCVTCHGAHEILPKIDPASKVHRQNVASTCGSCHVGILAPFSESIHGRKLAEGDTSTPTCNTCHTAHDIIEGGSKKFQLGVIRECGGCHAEYFHTYRDNFHGKITELGVVSTAKCADCHTPHSIFPASDTRSSVHPGGLVQTCKQCHAGANENFVRFDPHADPENEKRNPALHWSYVLMTMLLFGTFAFFGLHTVLWFIRESIEKQKESRHGRD